MHTIDPVRYATGESYVSADDLVVAGGGLFGQARVYGTQTQGLSTIPLGNNWWIKALPSMSSGASQLTVIFDPQHRYPFQQSGSSTKPPLYPWQGYTLTENTTTKTYTFSRSYGGRFEVAVFNSLSAPINPLAFVSYTDARGITTTITSQTGSQINEVQRTYTLNGSAIIDSLQYAYSGSLLQTVTYRQQVGGGAWTNILQAAYTYYGTGDSNGSLNDLKTATQLTYLSGSWTPTAVSYYRYYIGGAMKMAFGPEAYRLVYNAGITILTASDAAIQPYADNYYEYSGGKVTKQVSAVCDSCVGGGNTTDLFSYSTNPHFPGGSSYNVWQTKCVQTLPDNSQIIVYSNAAGTPMLYVNVDPTGANMWATFYRYDVNGQMIWEAKPSAVALPASLSTLEAYNDLLNYNGTTYQYLNNSSGLINVTSYYAATNIALGQVQYYVSGRGVMQGQTGSYIAVSSTTYTSNTDSNSNTIYPTLTEVMYPVAGSTSTTITTTYSYTFYSGTNQMQSRTTTPPVVSTGQNGSGSPYTIVEQFDAYGNRTSVTDERSVTNTSTYNGLGLMSQQVLNVQAGITQPGVNITSTFTYDTQGRITQALGPTHTVVLSGVATSVQRATCYIYTPSPQPTSGTWGPDQTWAGSGYLTSGTYSLINPVSLTFADKDGRITDQITSKRSSGSGALSPTDTFNQSDWQTWSSTQYNIQHQTISSRVYFLIPSSGTGTVGISYGETDYGYDALERQNRMVSPGFTITRTVWTTPQRVASVWVGTNDTGATDSNPAGTGSPNNMVIVNANVYDNGGIGDGNVTQTTTYASATDTRVTNYGYDFRDRQTSTTDATGRYFTSTYDNLGRQTQSQSYATNGGTLIGQNQTNYDDSGRVYQSLTYAVDPSTGAVGNTLTSNSWYDPSGNLLQQVGSGNGKMFSKSVYNGIGWVTSSYSGYNTTGTSYSQASTVANDIIVEQTDNTYDEAGNLISQAMSQRLNDTPATGTGALSYTTQPKARVSYMAMWYDGIDRSIASAAYGAIASFTRPTTPPASSDTILVASAAYDDAGRLCQVTDAMSHVNQTSYDAASRTTQTIEAYGSGSDRTTSYTYTLDNLTATMTAVNPTTGDQTTTWTYGTGSSSGVYRNDPLASVTYPDSVSGSDVVSYTYNRQGQKLSITDQRGTVRTFYYDTLGRTTDDCVSNVGSNTDATVLRISRGYEVRGMTQTITSASAATPGTGTVLNQVKLTYNTFGQLVQDQQEHGGTVTGTTPSVGYAYDSGGSNSNEIRFNQLTYPNGRTIAYSYGTSGGMSDYLNRVDAIQDTSSGTTTLSAYTYLGAGMVIRIQYPEPQVMLDLWGGTSGVFAGFDQFNRIIDQRWLSYAGGSSSSSSSSRSSSSSSSGGGSTDLDRYQYGYDRNSNRIWKANLVGTPVVAGGLDELYAYDPLNRLTQMQRGVLNSTHTALTSTPVKEQDWTLDATGNWSGFVDKVNGATDLNQTRTANKVNEITAIGAATGPTWVTPQYDQAGNTIRFPQVTDPTQGFTAVYDAWNRMVSVSSMGGGSSSSSSSGGASSSSSSSSRASSSSSAGGSSSSSSSGRSSSSSSSSGYGLVAQYRYDGRGFRVLKYGYTSGLLSETRHFYFTSKWQDIEERVGTSSTMSYQYVWGVRYIDELVCRDSTSGSSGSSSSNSSNGRLSAQRLYVLHDANFNITAIVAALQGILQRLFFDPFGAVTFLDRGWQAGLNLFAWEPGFQGLITDRVTNVPHARTRSLNTLLGRWIQRDSLGYLDATSLYLFEKNSPASTLDPRGTGAYISKAKPSLCYCGLDITSQFDGLRSQVTTAWNNAAKSHKAIPGQPGPGPTGQEAAAADFPTRKDWEIYQLAWQKNKFKRNPPCKHTVTIHGKCYNAEEVNYYMFGLAYFLIQQSGLLPQVLSSGESFTVGAGGDPTYRDQDASDIIASGDRSIFLWRAVSAFFTGIGGRKAWFHAGYYGDLTLAAGAERTDCIPSTVLWNGQLGGYIGDVDGDYVLFGDVTGASDN